VSQQVFTEEDLEGVFLFGGGSRENPSNAAVYVDHFGHVCEPELEARPPPLWGAGAAGVDVDAIIVCGGRANLGKINDEVIKPLSTAQYLMICCSSAF